MVAWDAGVGMATIEPFFLSPGVYAWVPGQQLFTSPFQGASCSGGPSGQWFSRSGRPPGLAEAVAVSPAFDGIFNLNYS